MYIIFNYSNMNIKTKELICKGLSPAALILLRLSQEDLSAELTLKEMADRQCVTVRTIQTAIKQLEKMNLVIFLKTSKKKYKMFYVNFR